MDNAEKKKKFLAEVRQLMNDSGDDSLWNLANTLSDERLIERLRAVFPAAQKARELEALDVATLSSVAQTALIYVKRSPVNVTPLNRKGFDELALAKLVRIEKHGAAGGERAVYIGGAS